MRRCVRAVRPSFLIAPLAFAIQCVPVHADDAGLELEEIVVTAQRRAEHPGSADLHGRGNR